MGKVNIVTYTAEAEFMLDGSLDLPFDLDATACFLAFFCLDCSFWCPRAILSNGWNRYLELRSIVFVADIYPEM